MRKENVVHLFEITELTCTKCKQTKSVSEFQKDRYKNTGYCTRCKQCVLPSKRASYIRYKSDHAKRDKVRKNDIWYQRKFTYGINKEDYFRMLSDQGGVCAICKQVPKGDIERVLHVDHNHVTGKVRGLLCRHCNHAIGQLKDSLTILRNACQYLEERGSYGS